MVLFRLLYDTGKSFAADRCPRMAASIAYYTIFSLPPLLMILLSLSSQVVERGQVEGQIEHEVASVLGEEGASQITQMLQQGDELGEKWWARILGVGALLFGATGVIVGLQSAINEAWKVQPDPNKGGVKNFVVKRLLSIGLIVGGAFLLLVSLLATAAIAAIGEQMRPYLPGDLSARGVEVANTLLSLLVVWLVFAAIFRYLPDAQVRWSDVAIGALITALLFVAGKTAMGLYLGSRDMSNTYGAAGSLVLLMLWVYYSAMILLFGAEFTWVWAQHRGHGVVPTSGAVQVVSTIQPVDAPTTPPRETPEAGGKSPATQAPSQPNRHEI